MNKPCLGICKNQPCLVSLSHLVSVSLHTPTFENLHQCPKAIGEAGLFASRTCGIINVAYTKPDGPVYVDTIDLFTLPSIQPQGETRTRDTTQIHSVILELSIAKRGKLHWHHEVNVKIASWCSVKILMQPPAHRTAAHGPCWFCSCLPSSCVVLRRLLVALRILCQSWRVDRRWHHQCRTCAPDAGTCTLTPSGTIPWTSSVCKP